MKIRPVEAAFFGSDRRTDMTKLIGTFRSFSNTPKKIHNRFFVEQIPIL
jgi:hypothetical protein